MSNWYFCYQGWWRTLFGQETVETLGLLHAGPLKANNVVCQHTKNYICRGYQDLFTGIGLLKDYELRLHLDKSLKPVAQPVRRILFGLFGSCIQPMLQLSFLLLTSHLLFSFQSNHLIGSPVTSIFQRLLESAFMRSKVSDKSAYGGLLKGRLQDKNYCGCLTGWSCHSTRTISNKRLEGHHV